MSDPLARVAVVIGVVLVVALVVWSVRLRTPSGTTAQVALAPGIYLFSTSTCADCVPVNDLLVRELGEGGFTRIEWAGNEATFETLGIEVVPTTLIVAADGRAERYPGDPSDGLRHLGP
jgi:hypothetical protein